MVVPPILAHNPPQCALRMLAALEQKGIVMSDDENEKKLKTIKEFVGGLTPREAEVLRKRFGVEFQIDADLKEIGNQFDVTRKRIKEIENMALKKLSKSRGEKQPIQKTKVEECSFCGIELSNAVKYAKGKSGVFICASCLEACGKILEEDDPETS